MVDGIVIYIYVSFWSSSTAIDIMVYHGISHSTGDDIPYMVIGWMDLWYWMAYGIDLFWWSMVLM